MFSLFVDLGEFAAIALDPESETFVIHITSISSVMLLSSSLLDIHLFHIPQMA